MPGYETNGVNYEFGAINIFQTSWCKYKQIIKSKLVLFLLFREKLKKFFCKRERNEPQSDS